MRIDLHTHSDVSDGTDPPAVLVSAAVAAGLDVIALTDHDTLDGIAEAVASAAAGPVAVLPGIELSTCLQGRSVHLLGYGCRPDASLLAELERLRSGRNDRIPTTVRRLTELGYPITLAEVERHAHGTSVGRPHVADALVARGHVADRDEAFERLLADGGPAYVDRYATDLPTAIGLVHAAGGVAVIAHPWSRGSQQTLPEPVIAELAAQTGLDGIEVDHPDHDQPTRTALRGIAERTGLLTTGSSDHHGTGKTRNPLGAETTDPAVLAEILRRITAHGGERGSFAADGARG
ncbi:MAG: PHP domain-containing protein [Propioniciclava sp.]